MCFVTTLIFNLLLFSIKIFASPSPFLNESFKYEIVVGFIPAGYSTLSIKGIKNSSGRNVLHIYSTAVSNSFVDIFYKVRDVNESWMDESGKFSYGYQKNINEGFYSKFEKTIFDYTNNKSFVWLRKDEKSERIEYRLDNKVLDVLSALYYVRLNMEDITDKIVLSVNTRGKTWDLEIKKIGEETVETPAGKFECAIFVPKILKGENLFKHSGKLTVWISKDEKRIPVKMSSSIPIGSIYAILTEIK